MTMANQHKGSSDDITRTARALGAPAMPRSLCDFDHIADAVHGDGDDAMIAFTIGMRGSLTSHVARAAARAWHETIAMYPKSSICLEIAGYDSDPRELWRISEASRHVRRWARYANLTDIFDAARTPLDPASLSVLAKCGAFEDVDPETVPMAEPTLGATH
jgi:hypothetical protein